MKVTIEQLKKIIEEEMAAEELEEANTRPLEAATRTGNNMDDTAVPLAPTGDSEIKDDVDKVASHEDAKVKTRPIPQVKTRPIRNRVGVSAGGFEVFRPKKVNESLLKKLIREELEEKKVLQDPTIDDLIDNDESITDKMKDSLKNKLKGMPLSHIKTTFKKPGGYADLNLGRAEVRALASALAKL